MSHHSFSAVRQIRQAMVQPSRHGLRIVAVIIAALVGLAGNFMETSPRLQELDMGGVVEQIHSTLERRESLREIDELDSRGQTGVVA